MTKKRRNKHTKRSEAIGQSKTPIKKPKEISTPPKKKTPKWKLIWGAITVISIFLNFYLSYITFSPNVILEYAPSILPKDEMVLPIKVLNNGTLPIYDVIAYFEDSLVTKRDNSVQDIVTRYHLRVKLGGNDYVDCAHAFPLLRNSQDRPASGKITVTVEYNPPFLWGKGIITKEFQVFEDINNNIRWTTM